MSSSDDRGRTDRPVQAELSGPSAVRLVPLLKRTLWGGRRLGTRLGKPIGPEADYAESWEAVDRDDAQSVVADGPWAGRSLGDLWRSESQWLAGSVACPAPRFPLLLKYLDCHQVLSVQVHPDDEAAARQDPPDLGKTEAWYVVEAEADSVIYAGLRPGVTRAEVAQAVRAGETGRVLHQFRPRAGDCVFIPAGTVHALGAGLLVCEIQQSSDTTFRLFDWNRVDASGKGRTLHVDQALSVMDYDSGPVTPIAAGPTAPGWQTRVACDRFVLRSLTQGSALSGGDGRWRLMTIPEGSAELVWDHETRSLGRGETILVPASGAPFRIELTGGGVALEMGPPPEPPPFPVGSSSTS